MTYSSTASVLLDLPCNEPDGMIALDSLAEYAEDLMDDCAYQAAIGELLVGGWARIEGGCLAITAKTFAHFSGVSEEEAAAALAEYRAL